MSDKLFDGGVHTRVGQDEFKTNVHVHGFGTASYGALLLYPGPRLVREVPRCPEALRQNADQNIRGKLFMQESEWRSCTLLNIY